MTHEELMIPRVEVTNPWPACGYKKGTVLTADINEQIVVEGHPHYAVELPRRYPGNFRTLHWIERRTIAELPSFIAWHTGEVFPVKHWDYREDSATYTHDVGSEVRRTYAGPLEYYKSRPATEADYTAYLQSQNKG